MTQKIEVSESELKRIKSVLKIMAGATTFRDKLNCQLLWAKLEAKYPAIKGASE